MENKTYNGWTNYETWLCNIWFDDLSFLAEDCENFGGNWWGVKRSRCLIVKLRGLDRHLRQKQLDAERRAGAPEKQLVFEGMGPR